MDYEFSKLLRAAKLAFGEGTSKEQHPIKWVVDSQQLHNFAAAYILPEDELDALLERKNSMREKANPPAVEKIQKRTGRPAKNLKKPLKKLCVEETISSNIVFVDHGSK